jgi:H/ACA ribonucleoprotein complex subunit 4
MKRVLLPIEFAVKHLKNIVVRDSAVAALCYGAKLARAGVVALDEDIRKDEFVAMLTKKGELVALGKATMTSNEIAEAKSGIVTNTRKVIMEKDLYPREWK